MFDMEKRFQRNTDFRDSRVNVESKGDDVAYRRCGRLPCGSWRSPGGSRRRTNTSSPRGRGSPPPADATRWSSLHGSSALRTKGTMAQISFHYVCGSMSQGDGDVRRQGDESISNLIRLSAVNRSAICQEQREERLACQGISISGNLFGWHF